MNQSNNDNNSGVIDLQNKELFKQITFAKIIELGNKGCLPLYGHNAMIDIYFGFLKNCIPTFREGKEIQYPATEDTSNPNFPYHYLQILKNQIRFYPVDGKFTVHVIYDYEDNKNQEPFDSIAYTFPFASMQEFLKCENLKPSSIKVFLKSKLDLALEGGKCIYTSDQKGLKIDAVASSQKSPDEIVSSLDSQGSSPESPISEDSKDQKGLKIDAVASSQKSPDEIVSSLDSQGSSPESLIPEDSNILALKASNPDADQIEASQIIDNISVNKRQIDEPKIVDYQQAIHDSACYTSDSLMNFPLLLGNNEHDPFYTANLMEVLELLTSYHNEKDSKNPALAKNVSMLCHPLEWQLKTPNERSIISFKTEQRNLILVSEYKKSDNSSPMKVTYTFSLEKLGIAAPHSSYDVSCVMKSLPMNQMNIQKFKSAITDISTVNIPNAPEYNIDQNSKLQAADSKSNRRCTSSSNGIFMGFGNSEKQAPKLEFLRGLWNKISKLFSRSNKSQAEFASVKVNLNTQSQPQKQPKKLGFWARLFSGIRGFFSVKNPSKIPSRNQENENFSSRLSSLTDQKTKSLTKPSKYKQNNELNTVRL